ncbi:related to Dik6, novel virulence factor [Ustilago trichophora]|uniref:Related to Dik6, novel virulence factor n=1 Tax=Ustilago trichophora TaxID=86804 RepID=A0A5C3EEV7_9BASI|nr:related to Dik6, novel virulence factor [Ustilago trichophora]
MSALAVPDLAMPGKPISLSYPVDPKSMHFFHRGQTVGQVVKALFQLIYEPESNRNRIWLVSTEVEIVCSFALCFWLIGKKKSLGKIWFITKKDSPYGRYYVANAVFVLSVGVTAYLVLWDITAFIIAGFSFANRSTFEWWWIIPTPWWPLVMGVFVSGHGFTLACSPRSPLAPHRSATQVHKRWIYLPVPRRPAVLNTTLILPCVLFTTATITITALSGRAFFRARALAHDVIPADIMVQVVRSAKPPITFDGEHLLASDELIWAARRVGAAYMECHRYVCIHLLVYAGFAYGMQIPIVLYGVPNLVSLVEHACSRLPEPLPASCKGFLQKALWLLTKGKPRSENNTTHLNLATWKMTVLAMAYVSMLATIIPLFGLVPIYIVAKSFPHEVKKGDISPSIRDATIAVSIITILSCTCIVLFCTVASLDPLFRTAIGLNMIRNQAPIDIYVNQHCSEHGDQLCQRQMLEHEQEQDHSIALKPSISTFKSVTEDDSSGKDNGSVSRDLDSLGEDGESGRHVGSNPSVKA